MANIQSDGAQRPASFEAAHGKLESLVKKREAGALALEQPPHARVQG
jgi:exonuclease VII small subunit